MKFMIAITVAFILLLGICLCQAQTNAAPVANAPATQTSLIDAITKLVEAIGSLGAAVLILARVLRKAIPDDWQTGTAGRLLAHTALEVNPQLTPTPPNVPNPSVELKDTATGSKVEAVPKTPPN